MFGVGVLGILYTMFCVVADVIHEAEQGDHTRVVQISHRYGMILFIASEVMFFVAWFWAYFDVSLFPGEAIEYTRARPSPAATGRRRASSRSTPGTCRCSTR